jgi:hypothetical protein
MPHELLQYFGKNFSGKTFQTSYRIFLQPFAKTDSNLLQLFQKTFDGSRRPCSISDSQKLDPSQKILPSTVKKHI